MVHSRPALIDTLAGACCVNLSPRMRCFASGLLKEFVNAFKLPVRGRWAVEAVISTYWAKNLAPSSQKGNIDGRCVQGACKMGRGIYSHICAKTWIFRCFS